MSSPFQFANFHTVDGRIVPVDPAILSLQFDASANPILYLGESFVGASVTDAVWRIQRFDVTSGVAQTWANGTSSFSNVWADRASLSYS